jgi:acyl carrier protein
MKNREDILQFIKQIMLEMFEIEEQLITLNARLREDLDFDSIDAVDMIVKLKEVTGKAVQPEDFKNAKTINDVVEAVYK